MTDPTPSLEGASVAALLTKRSRDEANDLLDELVLMLSEVVPGVEVERSLLRRQVTALRVPLGGFVYVLKKGTAHAFEASRQQVVRGVAIRTVPMEIHDFLAELGVALDAELCRTEEGRAALQRWLSTTNP